MTAAPRKPARWALSLLAVAVLAAACTGSAGEGPAPATRQTEGTGASGQGQDGTGAPDDTGGQGGTVVFGADQEPDILNSDLTAGNLQATSIVTVPLFAGAYTLTPDFEYVPDLIDGEAEVTEDPFTVTYRIKDEAAWSDGTPITADDFEFTWQTKINPDFDITSRTGYELITSAEKPDDKTITFTFSEPFASYRTLFNTTDGNGVLPKHVLEGQDFDTVWNDAIVNPETGEPIASGPFMFDSWNKGRDLTIVRNEDYWGEPAGLDSIVFRFLEDSNTQVQALRGGEIDMMYPQPQLDLVEQLESIEGIETQISAGTVYEHLDFNLAVPPLEEKFVREAIARGIDRDAIVQAVIAPIQPDAEVLQSVIYVPNQEEYEPHFDIYDYDPQAATTLLEDNGCTREGQGNYVCGETELTFGYTTTAGNEARELQLQVIQAQLAEIGIGIESATGPAAQVFGDTLPAGPEGAWDLFNFAWVASPDPVGNIAIFECDGEQNYNSYCDEEVTAQLQATNSLVDEEERAALFNEIDEALAEDLPLLPLYQKPTLLAFHNRIQGPQDNPTNQGPTWNAGEWVVSD